MPLISDGTGTYTIRKDGTRDYGAALSFKINDESVYEFDPKTGILSVSASPEKCSLLMKILGLSKEEEPKNIRLGIGLTGEEINFNGVREIISLPPRKSDGEWFFEKRKEV